MKRFLGIDVPAKLNLGWSVIEKDKQQVSIVCSGVENTSGEWIGQSFDHVLSWLKIMLDTYHFDVIVIERQSGFGCQSLREKLIGFQAMVQLFCYRNSIPLFMISPKTAKKCVCGNGNASKQNVIDKVLEIFKNDYPENYELPEHVADSIAMVLSQIEKEK